MGAGNDIATGNRFFIYCCFQILKDFRDSLSLIEYEAVFITVKKTTGFTGKTRDTGSSSEIYGLSGKAFTQALSCPIGAAVMHMMKPLARRWSVGSAVRWILGTSYCGLQMSIVFSICKALLAPGISGILDEHRVRLAHAMPGKYKRRARPAAQDAGAL